MISQSIHFVAYPKFLMGFIDLSVEISPPQKKKNKKQKKTLALK